MLSVFYTEQIRVEKAANMKLKVWTVRPEKSGYIWETSQTFPSIYGMEIVISTS